MGPKIPDVPPPSNLTRMSREDWEKARLLDEAEEASGGEGATTSSSGSTGGTDDPWFASSAPSEGPDQQEQQPHEQKQTALFQDDCMFIDWLSQMSAPKLPAEACPPPQREVPAPRTTEVQRPTQARPSRCHFERTAHSRRHGPTRERRCHHRGNAPRAAGGLVQGT